MVCCNVSEAHGAIVRLLSILSFLCAMRCNGHRGAHLILHTKQVMILTDLRSESVRGKFGDVCGGGGQVLGHSRQLKEGVGKGWQRIVDAFWITGLFIF